MDIKISDIKNELELTDASKLDDIINKYRSDTRTGVIKLIQKFDREREKLIKEQKRSEQMKVYENKYNEYTYICGIDEVGRGPLAGPVVAAAVILPKDCNILYINDSKQVSEKKREELYDLIMEQAVAVGVGSIPPSKIDEINILQATYEAMRQAIANLSVKPEILLIDAVTIPEITIRQVPIIKGDAKSISIAAASIIAKVTRDRLMVAYDSIFPQYDFASNKGYGSKEHIEVLKRLGPTPIHRLSFIKNFF
ncbi:ribonuclease HII [Anaerocolumna sp. MB42-C2]|uniref:ribonuclease HII n=1 Tax=Anaerocolumna sp. MB42-C2 TaxID=3070997 RepID=UPI0027DF1136|nr:ribonuclease HII [Anaerocolumna sp. MB42-C2]WMJ88288.1 ribonuclease HII [Anaerocolumna sp. MB42-C2]